MQIQLLSVTPHSAGLAALEDENSRNGFNMLHRLAQGRGSDGMSMSHKIGATRLNLRAPPAAFGFYEHHGVMRMEGVETVTHHLPLA